MSSTIVDPAFKVIPTQQTFFLVWRIEKLQVIPVPEEQYGTFYNGDSYIIISGTDGKEVGGVSRMKPREVKEGTLEIHIHFWLGSKTSQDEAAVAAYKTVELDDHLGGFPIQHREVEGHESKRFLAYFRRGLTILEGGVASGLNHVEKANKPRLFHVKGKRIPIVREVTPISWSSMNHGDVFILDSVVKVFLWNGNKANYMEKIQGAKIGQQLRSQHGPECNGLVIMEDGSERESTSADEIVEFEKYLPLADKQDSLGDEQSISDQQVEEKIEKGSLKLYKVSDESGSLKITLINSSPLAKDDLDSQDCFIIDNGTDGIWVWIGKGASAKERIESMRNAQGFIVKKGYPHHICVTRIIDGGEPIEFKCLFKSWKESNSTVGLGKTYSAGGKVVTLKDLEKLMPKNKLDVRKLYDNPSLAAETQMLDDGSGEKDIYRISSFDRVPVDPADYGNFYSGDCYIIVYTSVPGSGSRPVNVIYYWIGNESSVNERGTAAVMTVQLDDERFGGAAVQVRVVEGKEPPHFTALFAGKMIIYKGNAKSGGRSEKGSTVDPTKEKCILQVRGTNKYVNRAVEVDCEARSLNSNDVFILFTSSTIYIWAGKGSTGDEREMARICAKRVEDGREVILVSEGQEKSDFWEAIGGQQPYSQEKGLELSEPVHPIRLFQCSNSKGYFYVDEIVDFNQSDLIEEDVMLLDTWDTILVWIGSKSNPLERERTIEMVEEYLKADPSERDLETPIIIVKQGSEPPNFTGFFGSWDRNYWSSLATSNPNVSFDQTNFNEMTSTGISN
ncbi:gelsolin-like isoform X2 [Panonychus citri]|uniref:gelsolin-like isoform X2 n=1 Tax=Panonychus citri TaxID=50023 RepID=UPI0023076C26|nr:gelsolin-like isoform X2 [Panonychus citri]